MHVCLNLCCLDILGGCICKQNVFRWCVIDLHLKSIWTLWTGHQKEKYYHNDPKFSDRYALAKSADPDQTAPRGALIRVYTVCHSVCIIWTHYSMVEPHSSNFRAITTNSLGVRIFKKFTVRMFTRYARANFTNNNWAKSEENLSLELCDGVKYKRATSPENLSSGVCHVPNRLAQLQTLARVLKFWIYRN